MVCLSVYVCLVLVPRCSDLVAHVLDGRELEILAGPEFGPSWGVRSRGTRRHMILKVSPLQKEKCMYILL